MNLKRSFLEHCKKESLEINANQINIIELIDEFYQKNFNGFSLLNLFSKKNNKLGFYLY
jgi:cell division protein ZapE